MNSDTIGSMVNFIYTGEFAEGWEDLDIQDMAETAYRYDLSDWMGLFCSKLRTEEVSAEKVAEMMIVGSRFKHSAARELLVVARDKITELLGEEGGH